MTRLAAIARATAVPLAGLVVTYAIFILVPAGQRFDVAAWHGRFVSGWRIRQADLRLLETISVSSLVMVLVVLIAIAVIGGRWRAGLGAVAAVLGALGTVEALKFALPSLSWKGDEWRWLTTSPMGSFPSGHSVIVASVALAMLSISSPSWRRVLAGPLAAAVVVFTTATLTMGWHRPSDVLGSFFVATIWNRAVMVLVARDPLPLAPVREASRTRPNLLAGAWLLACWGFASALVVGAAAKGILDRVDRSSFGGGLPSLSNLPDLGFRPGSGFLSFDLHQAVAYGIALSMLVVAAGVTIAAGGRWLAARPDADHPRSADPGVPAQEHPELLRA